MDLLFTDISVLSPLLRRDGYWTSGGCCRRKVQERGVTPSWVEWRAKVSFGGTDAFWRISRLLTWLPSRTLTHCMHALAHTCRHKQWCGNGKVRPHPFDSTVCADKLTGSCKINTCTRKYVNISSRWKHCNWNGLLAQRLQCSWNGPKKIKSGFRRNQCYSEQSFFWNLHQRNLHQRAKQMCWVSPRTSVSLTSVTWEQTCRRVPAAWDTFKLSSGCQAMMQDDDCASFGR